MYRELNKKENRLSKEAILNLWEGMLCIVKEAKGASLPTKVIPLFNSLRIWRFKDKTSVYAKLYIYIESCI